MQITTPEQCKYCKRMNGLGICMYAGRRVAAEDFCFTDKFIPVITSTEQIPHLCKNCTETQKDCAMRDVKSDAICTMDNFYPTRAAIMATIAKIHQK